MLLIKPQFEAGRGQVGRGGIVSDPAVHLEVLERVAAALAERDLVMVNIAPSPIRGAAGNIEFLGHFLVGAPTATLIGRAALAAAVDEVRKQS